METLNLGIDGLDEVEQIGRGGSSRVFRAKQVELDRLVALKVLKAGDDPSVVRRFDRERRAMGRLSLHDGIVPVYSSGLTDNDEPYLIMPYYENGSLQDRINEGPLPWQEAVVYMMEAATTMKAAHEAGVVHLDLKPANILLSNNNAPRIADFGIAKLVNDPNSTAKTTGAAFTPTFSAPEVLLGGSAAPTADVYGLAATLWSLISGKAPFRAETAEENSLMAVVGRVVNDPIGDLRHMAPDPICTVIETGMAKDPATRYPTAGAFADALAAAHHAVTTGGGGPTGTGGPVTQRQPSGPVPVASMSNGRPQANGHPQADGGRLGIGQPVPPRLVPAASQRDDLLARYAVLGVVAAAALATVVILLGLRSLGGDDAVTPTTTTEQLITRATTGAGGLPSSTSTTAIGGVRSGDDPTGPSVSPSTTVLSVTSAAPTSESTTTTTDTSSTSSSSSSTSSTSTSTSSTTSSTSSTTSSTTTSTTDPTSTSSSSSSTSSTTDPTSTTTEDPAEPTADNR